jgi:penicillin-binding protein 1A
VIRAVLSFLGFVFSWLTLGLAAAVIGVGAVLWVYARDLPDHEQLADYAPPTISRIYSSEGRLIDEFARENGGCSCRPKKSPTWSSRLSSRPRTRISTTTRAMTRAASRRPPMRRTCAPRGRWAVQGASTITQQVMKNFLLSSDYSIERKIKEAILAVRIEQRAVEGSHSRTVPQRDLPRTERLWRRRRGAALFRQGAGGV